MSASEWFQTALDAITPALQARPGLQALRPGDRDRIHRDDPRRLQGSVDIDAALRDTAPQEPRWDYAIAYEDAVWFVEVHPATSDTNVREVERKAGWLRTLLTGSTLLEAPRTRGLYWLATGRTSTAPRFAKRIRRLAQARVVGPTSRLRLTA